MNTPRTDLWRRGGLAVAVAAPLLLTACTGDPDASDADEPHRPTGIASLISYTSCDDLLGYFQENALEHVTAWGLGPHAMYATSSEAIDFDTFGASDLAAATGDSARGGAAYSGPDHGTSATNNQVAGVDEADIVKTDGEIVVALVGNAVRIVDAASAEAVGSVDAEPGSVSQELLLQGSTLLVLGTEGGGYGYGWDAGFGDSAVVPVGPARTVLTQVDLSDPSEPVVVQSTRLEGAYRSARLVDGTVRLVMASDPPGLEWVQPEGRSLAAETEALESNRELIEASSVTDWLPHLSVDGGAVEPLLGCGDVGVPTEFSGFTTVSVVTLDIDGGTVPTSAAGVVGTGHTVYSSTERVIVASSPWDTWAVQESSDEPSTDLHAFDVADPGATTYVGSGRVAGRLLDQFSIDERDGVVRVATTQDARGSEPSSSSLVVLAEQAGEGLVETGRVDGLGETERIYAVRYLSPDLAAVVTFRQVDPLYLVDTSDPAAPALAGELKIPGYSAYLHPLPDGRLLGVGQHATEDGRTTGLQVSLFDVADPSAPVQESTVTWPGRISAVESDHRAFLIWQDRVYLPSASWLGRGSEVVLSTDVDPGALTEGPKIEVGAGLPAGGFLDVQRVLVVEDRIWLVGRHGVARVAEGNRELGDLLTF